MFGKLKGLFGGKEKQLIMAPLLGTVAPLSAVNDPVFSQETMGKGVAVIPGEGKVFAPADGVVTMVFATGHAIGMTTDGGVELLIHVGLDTVQLKGACFTALVAAGDKVKSGDLLLEFDREQIKAKGYEVITPIIVCNTKDYKEILCHVGKDVKAGDVIMELDKL